MRRILLTLGGAVLGAFLAASGTAYALGSPIFTFGGGTGSTSPSGILSGDNGATNHLNTVTIGSGLSFTGGTLSATGGGGGSGNVATSSQETSGRIPFWTSTNGTPALLSGGSANLTWNNSTNLFTVGGNASTTQLSVSGNTYLDTGTTGGVSIATTSILGSLTVNSTNAVTGLTYGSELNMGQIPVVALVGGSTNDDKFTPAIYAYALGKSSVTDPDPTAGIYAEDNGGTLSATGGPNAAVYAIQDTAFSTGGQNYALYATGGFNYLGGNTGIGTTTPYSTLSIGGNVVVGASSPGGTLGDLFIPKYGTSAGAFAAFDSTGKLISTTTPSGGSGTVTSISLVGIDGVTPITTTGTITAQISTSTVPSVGGLAYWTGAGTPSTVGTIATSSISFSTAFTLSGGAAFSDVGTVGGVLSCNAASGLTPNSQLGCISHTDWNTFNGKQNSIVFTTSGTSGAATFDGTNLNIPQYISGKVATSSSEVANEFPFWTTNSATPALLSGTSNLFNSSGNIGVATSSPWAQFAIGMASTTPGLVVGVAGSSSPSLYVGPANANGYVGFGTSVPDSPITIDMNSVTPPVLGAFTGTTFHSVGANALANRIVQDSFGAATVYSLRRADGTGASPIALASGDNVFTFGGAGYTGAAYSSTKAQFNMVTTQAWTATANGIAFNWLVTPNNSTTLFEAMRLDQSGYLGIGTTSPFAEVNIATSSVSVLPGGAFGQLGLTDPNGGLNLKNLLLSYEKGTFSISTVTDTNGSSTLPEFRLDSNGIPFFSSLATGVLHSVAGVISSSLISLTSDVTGILGISNGGTGLNSIGASSTVLTSNGSSAVWQAVGGSSAPNITYATSTTGAYLQFNVTAGQHLLINYGGWASGCNLGAPEFTLFIKPNTYAASITPDTNAITMADVSGTRVCATQLFYEYQATTTDMITVENQATAAMNEVRLTVQQF